MIVHFRAHIVPQPAATDGLFPRDEPAPYTKMSGRFSRAVWACFGALLCPGLHAEAVVSMDGEKPGVSQCPRARPTEMEELVPRWCRGIGLHRDRASLLCCCARILFCIGLPSGASRLLHRRLLYLELSCRAQRIPRHVFPVDLCARMYCRGVFYALRAMGCQAEV